MKTESDLITTQFLIAVGSFVSSLSSVDCVVEKVVMAGQNINSPVDRSFLCQATSTLTSSSFPVPVSMSPACTSTATTSACRRTSKRHLVTQTRGTTHRRSTSNFRGPRVSWPEASRPLVRRDETVWRRLFDCPPST